MRKSWTELLTLTTEFSWLCGAKVEAWWRWMLWYYCLKLVSTSCCQHSDEFDENKSKSIFCIILLLLIWSDRCTIWLGMWLKRVKLHFSFHCVFKELQFMLLLLQFQDERTKSPFFRECLDLMIGLTGSITFKSSGYGNF